jgi:hypothetical protein
MTPRVDPTHPANLRVLQTLRAGNPDGKPVAAPGDVTDPYAECGSHPDIVERVWGRVGKRLPMEARCVLFGTPALVQPASGVVLAVCMGTRYVMRVPAAQLSGALASGYRQTHTWKPGDVTDLTTEFGADWVFGAFEDAEVNWCREAFDQFGSASAGDDQMLTPATSSGLPPAPEGALVLEVAASLVQAPRRVAIDPDTSTIEKTLRGLDWSRMNSVVLRRGDDWLEVSGSTNPADGLSAMHAEDGREYVTSDAPENLDVLVRLLTSYAAGDDVWRTIVAWE